jgi:acetoacetyl-CoA synthetase
MGSTDLNQSRSNGSETPAKLWEHPNPRSTEMYKFLQTISQKFGKRFESYDDLYRWSIDHISDFWGEVWHYTGIVGTKYENVILDPTLSTN